ncbi:MAG: hypothetical protein GY765_03515 [bacterium]|nr:hypothetical protein [bacterium]
MAPTNLSKTKMKFSLRRLQEYVDATSTGTDQMNQQELEQLRAGAHRALVELAGVLGNQGEMIGGRCDAHTPTLSGPMDMKRCDAHTPTLSAPGSDS